MAGSGLMTAATGEVLWSFFAGAGVNAPPVSYAVDGKQYIAVGAGGNTNLPFKRGNDIIAFALIDRPGSTPRQTLMSAYGT